MPRIRSVKPEFWADFPTAQLSRDARLLYIALWNFADEHGRLAGDPRFVKGQVFPYDDDLSSEAVDVLLDELAHSGRVVRYDVAGAPYLHLPKLGRHQRLEPNKVPSRIPDPPDPDAPPPGADKSARNGDATPVDNGNGAPPDASSQVRGASEVRADESAQDADESSLLQGAGSMEQAAGGNARELPPPLQILRRALDARKLHVRWDTLTDDQVAEIEQLIERHGDGPLVAQAMREFRPDRPAVYVTAWLRGWRDLRAPGDLVAVDEPTCTEPGHTGTARYCRECAAERLAGGAE